MQIKFVRGDTYTSCQNQKETNIKLESTKKAGQKRPAYLIFWINFDFYRFVISFIFEI